MKENNITNFGYVIKFDNQANLSILLENHELLNNIIVDSDEGVYESLDDYDMCIVGVTVTDDDDNIFSVDNLDDNNISSMVYTIIPLFIYRPLTVGLTMEDFVNLDLINLLFYNVLDDYIKERN
jgi:hypothetical protein